MEYIQNILQQERPFLYGRVLFINKRQRRKAYTAAARKKQPSVNEVKERIIQKQKKIDVNVIRCFKDYTIEKWYFTIDNEKIENIIYIRDAEIINVDIVMHQKYKSKEKEILPTLKNILGLRDYDLDINKQYIIIINKI